MSTPARRSPRAISTMPSRFQPLPSQPRPPLQHQLQQSLPTQPPLPVSEAPPPQKPNFITSATNVSVPEANNGTKMDEGEVKPKKPKVPCTVRRLRRNKLLSRMIQPKPAVMLLYELRPGATFVFQEPSVPANCGGTFISECIWQGKVIGRGEAPSKMGAKNKASEAALKSIVIESVNPDGTVTEKTATSTDSNDESMETEEEELSTYEKLPWSSLASFALHRLFANWREEGLDIPLPSAPKTAPVNGLGIEANLDELKVPENAKDMHPVSFLNQMHPGIKVEELQRTNAPNSSVTVGYRINGQLYTGTATNGKLARKIAATHACNTVYGLKFEA